MAQWSRVTPPASAGDARDAGFIPESGKSPGGSWQPTPVFLPGKSQGQRRLVSYSSWECKESDTTECAQTHTHTHTYTYTYMVLALSFSMSYLFRTSYEKPLTLT